MKKVILLILFFTFTTCVFAQRRVDRDTIRIHGKPVALTITNWYCIEGDKCPSFTVKNVEGKKIKSKELRGKTVIISFWISSCMPCRRELARIGAELVSKYPSDKFTCLAIGVGENAKSAKKFQELAGIPFPLCYDKFTTVYPKFADNGFPKLFVVDSKGIIRLTEQGYNEKKFSHLKKVIAELVEL